MTLLTKHIVRVGLLLAVLLAMPSAFAGDKEDAVWIDVRTQQEWDAGHLERATLIPHTAIADKIGALTEDKDANIKLYCRSGGRAGMAKKTLEEMGYTNVTNVGGYEDAQAYVAKEDQ